MYSFLAKSEYLAVDQAYTHSTHSEAVLKHSVLFNPQMASM